jgi:hypothetical protein
MNGAGVEEGVERLGGLELLAERDRDRGRAGERGVAGDVVAPQRLLEPENVERLGELAEALKMKPLTRQSKAESVEANRRDGSERVTRIAPSAMPRAPRERGGRV